MRTRLRLYLDLIRWDRPAGWLLLLWPTLSALWLAAGGFPGWHLLGVFTLGTILMRSAGCCINDVADRHFDRHVQRTAQRPVTSGRISAREALAVGAVLALCAFALALSTRWLVIAWAIPALCITLIYPYTKRCFAMPQAVLGVAYSMGIPMAYAAVRAEVPAEVGAMLLANVCWTLAYDTQYAMVDRQDDLRLGLKTSAITLGRCDVGFVMLCHAAHIAIWWTLLWRITQPAAMGTMPLQALMDVLKSIYRGGEWASNGRWRVLLWAATLLCAVAQALWHGSLIRKRERAACFRSFTQNHWMGATLFAAAALLSVPTR